MSEPLTYPESSDSNEMNGEDLLKIIEFVKFTCQIPIRHQHRYDQRSEENNEYLIIGNSDQICTCMAPSPSIQLELGPQAERNKLILSTVARTEEYLRERKILELVQFLFTKLLSQTPENPMLYLEKILDDCMLYRAGHAVAPVLYETSHLQAVIASFDPGQRGWLSVGQVSRLYTTLGLFLDTDIAERSPTDVVLKMLKQTQDDVLHDLVSTGVSRAQSEF